MLSSKWAGNSTLRRVSLLARPYYRAMVAEDGRLRLAGYEAYRFGGAVLMMDGAELMLS